MKLYNISSNYSIFSIYKLNILNIHTQYSQYTYSIFSIYKLNIFKRDTYTCARSEFKLVMFEENCYLQYIVELGHQRYENT